MRNEKPSVNAEIIFKINHKRVLCRLRVYQLSKSTLQMKEKQEDDSSSVLLHNPYRNLFETFIAHHPLNRECACLQGLTHVSYTVNSYSVVYS